MSITHLICVSLIRPWWRHQMETFSALLALCEGIGGFPSQRPVTFSFDVFFDLRLHTRLSKQQRRLWFETPSPSLWRHCDDVGYLIRACGEWIMAIDSLRGFEGQGTSIFTDVCHEDADHALIMKMCLFCLYQQGWFQVCAQPMRDVVFK